MTQVTISEEASELLRARMAASGLKRPCAKIAMNTSESDARPAGDDDVDWTIRRRDLWALRVVEGEKFAEGDPRLVIVGGLGFISDFFPMRFDISCKDGNFRVAAAA